MHEYRLAHLSNAALLRDLAALVARDRVTTATMLAHLAEVDARRLYAPAGHSSMHAYCVEELRLSDDAAYKRIQAARIARQFPVLFTAVAEGRLHLTAVGLLAPHLTAENAAELIDSATHRRKSEIEEWLAVRFPDPAVPAIVRPVSTIRPIAQLAPAQVGSRLQNDLLAPAQVGNDSNGLSPAQVGTDSNVLAPAQVGRDLELPAQRYFVQLTIDKGTHERLRYAQALLSHAIPTGDLAKVLGHVLEAAIPQLEKRKLGASRRRPATSRGSANRSRSVTRSRYIPAQVRRAVWERDQGQCTFVGTAGHRCGARRFLEFDHVDPVARGGKATVDGMRLRCRSHNQYEAERAYGAEFMTRKRRVARLARALARVEAAEREQAARAAAEQAARAVAEQAALVAAEQAAEVAEREQTRDVIAGLRSLGCRADEARRAAELSGTGQGATLEERMRIALKYLSRRTVRGGVPAGTAT